MKRNSSDALIAPFPCTKVKSEPCDPPFSQVFSIARIDKSASTTDVSAVDCKNPDTTGQADTDKVRVGVSSKVNFSKLTQKEQHLRFQNQALEIKRLRKKLSKYMSNKGRRENSELQKAVDRVKSAKHEFEDQGMLVENVVKAVNTGKIVPNTLAYNQICTILRDVLAIPCPASKHAIRLPETTVPISRVEYEEYSRLPCTPAVLRALVGREQRHMEDLSEVLRALHMQAFMNIVHAKGGPAAVQQ